AIAGRDTLILVRVCWLRARCAAGLGQTQEARAGYNQARKDFRTHTLPYDYALTCLELAVLELRAGRFSEVQALAVEMGWIFGASGIHPEACLAVALFVEATKQATATADFASRVVRYLYRAQHDPALKFAEVEPGGLLPASLAPVRLT
ncbi:MAG TPA: hypothetical protein DD490_18100, partial [Acidobacteria bacterium]|nr:hypothetical protein [Acidobacteriota bacterium]